MYRPAEVSDLQLAVDTQKYIFRLDITMSRVSGVVQSYMPITISPVDHMLGVEITKRVRHLVNVPT